ncbi:MAG: hypothetical protein HDT28_01980 [Clostridiales bacterium]|nr:hypothetical protein [Clostridiales bacterium]
MKAEEKIKLQRQIRRTNRVMIKIFKTESGLSDFKTWFANKSNPQRIVLNLLKMTEEEFINQAIETNIDYQFYEEVRPITTFMILKANVYDAYLDTLDKTSSWHFRD